MKALSTRLVFLVMSLATLACAGTQQAVLEVLLDEASGAYALVRIVRNGEPVNGTIEVRNSGDCPMTVHVRSVTAISGGPWLAVPDTSAVEVAPGGGSARVPYTVSVKPPALQAPLAVGSYEARLELMAFCASTTQQAANAPRVVPIDLQVTDPTPTVAPATLSNGVKGTLYHQQLVAMGGIPPYTFSVSSGALPPGLALAGSTGVLAGTPTDIGSSTFTIAVRDQSGEIGSRTYTVVVGAGIVVSPANLPAGIEEARYQQTITATGGAVPYTFRVSAGALPEGLSLDASTGVLAGTPTSTGVFAFTVQATDTLGGIGDRPYSVEIAGRGELVINPASLPDGVQGTAYRQRLSVSGARGPNQFTVDTGQLPAGLSLRGLGDDAEIAGTPTGIDQSAFTILVRDFRGRIAVRAYTIYISPPALTLSPTTLSDGQFASPYRQQLSVSGGTGPYTFSVGSGALPSGIRLSSGSGSLDGTPLQAGVFIFSIEVRQPGGGVGTHAYTLRIHALVDPPSLPNGVQGTTYRQELSVASSAGQTTFVVASGQLPAGLTVVSTGMRTADITGTPTGTGASTFTIEARQSGGVVGTRNYTLSISASAPACPPKDMVGELEPAGQTCNDTIATADPYIGSSYIRGVLDARTSGVDIDVYRLVVPYDVSIWSVYVRPAEDVQLAQRPRPTFDVLRPDGSLLAAAPRGPELDTAGLSAREILFPAAGTYYLRVSNTAGGVSGPNSAYELRASVNDFVVNANLATFPADQSGTVVAPSASRGSNIPRFTMFMAAGSRVVTSVTAAGLPSASALDVRLSIYDNTDFDTTGVTTLVATNDDRSPTNRDPSIEWTVPRTGTYQFVLDWAGPAGAGEAYRLTLDCAPGHLAFSAPGDPLRSFLCLPVPQSEPECAPQLPGFASQRPNLLVNGGFETAPANVSVFTAPPSWSGVGGIPTTYDAACAPPNPAPDCFFSQPANWAAGSVPAEGRRFSEARDGTGLAQTLTLTPGRSYQLRARFQQSPSPASPARGTVRAYLGASVDSFSDGTASALGHFCATANANGYVERAYTFTAPPSAAGQRTLILVGMPVLTSDSLHLAIDAISLIDVTP